MKPSNLRTLTINGGSSWLGIPTEGYGFSNDSKGVMAAPSFSSASFSCNGENIDMTMSQPALLGA